jgi:hypothetical protein
VPQVRIARLACRAWLSVLQIWFGYAIFTIGLGLTTRFDVDSTPAYIIPVLCVNAMGVGCTIQTSGFARLIYHARL